MDDSRAFEIIEARADQGLRRGESPIPHLNKQVDGFSRNDVVKAFQRAFLMIGGVQRLALWGNANPDKFYPLYAKMLPSNSIQIGDNAIVQIVHALPPTQLDEHPEVKEE